MMRLVLLAIAALALLAPIAAATPGPDERLEDVRLEERARGLYRELRCVVCQSQSLDASNAPLAQDMRAVVRERLLAGESDSEIRAYMQRRYGDYVLMMPPLQGNTVGLWLMPLILLVGGGLILVIFVRHQRRRGGVSRDPADQAVDEARAARLLEEEGLE